MGCRKPSQEPGKINNIVEFSFPGEQFRPSIQTPVNKGSKKQFLREIDTRKVMLTKGQQIEKNKIECEFR